MTSNIKAKDATTDFHTLLNTSPFVARVSLVADSITLGGDCVRFATVSDGVVAWLVYYIRNSGTRSRLNVGSIQQTDPTYSEWLHSFVRSADRLANATHEGHQLAIRDDGVPVPLVSFQVVSLLDRCMGALDHELYDLSNRPSGSDAARMVDRLHLRFSQFRKEQRQPLCQINGL